MKENQEKKKIATRQLAIKYVKGTSLDRREMGREGILELREQRGTETVSI